MSTEQTDGPATESSEVEHLQARIAQLENELASLQAWANGAVADAQKRVYWLDRLHLDLDPIMRHLPIDFALGAFATLRDWYRWAKRPARAARRLVRRLSP